MMARITSLPLHLMLCRDRQVHFSHVQQTDGDCQKRKRLFFPLFSFQVALVAQWVMSRNDRHPELTLSLLWRIFSSFQSTPALPQLPCTCPKCFKPCKILPWGHRFLILNFLSNAKVLWKNSCKTCAVHLLAERKLHFRDGTYLIAGNESQQNGSKNCCNKRQPHLEVTITTQGDTTWCTLIACSKSQHRAALDTGSHLLKKLMNHLANKERSCLWSMGSKHYNWAGDPYHIPFTKGYCVLENCSILVWVGFFLILWKGVWGLFVVVLIFTASVLFVPFFA